MVDSRLRAYVSQLLSQGFAPARIRKELTRRGYKAADLDKVLPKRESSHLPLFLGLLVIILLVMGGIWYGISLSTPQHQLSITLVSEQSFVDRGQSLGFDISLQDAIEDPLPVDLSYIVLQENQAVEQTSESIILEGAYKSTQSLAIDLSPGRYDLSAQATSNEAQAKSSFGFTVTQPEITIIETPTNNCNSCDDYNSCTTDTCVKGRCIHVPTQPCCGNNLCETGENALSCGDDCITKPETGVTPVTAAAQTTENPETAAALCSQIPQDNERDACLVQQSENRNDKQFCGLVTDYSRRDNCYLTFALNGDSGVCTEIQDERSQRACLSYATFANAAQ
jgi:hypothetical protein